MTGGQAPGGRRRPPGEIVIVGGGFSGTVTAIRLLHLVPGVRITIIERSEANRHGGLAYGLSTSGWENFLNIQAGRITLFREEPNDFLAWTDDAGTSREDWPPSLRAKRFGPSDAIPRPMYRQYLTDRLSLIASRNERAEVVHISGEVVAVEGTLGEMAVTLAEGGQVKGDVAVLATGHLGPAVPPELRPISTDPSCIVDLYSEPGRVRLRSAGHDASVLVVGSGLAAVDVLCTLGSIGHVGPVTLVSRHGLQHSAYPPGHRHAIPQLTGRPRFLDVEPSEPAVRWAFLRDFSRLRRIYMAAGDPPGVAGERAWKALEPAVAEFCRRPDGHHLIATALRRYRAPIVASRIGSVHELTDTVEARRAAGTLTEKKAEILDAEIVEHGRIAVEMRSRGTDERLVYDLVVLATGRTADYGGLTYSPGDRHALWGRLIEQGLAHPEPITGAGIAVDEAGRLAPNSPGSGLFAIGPMRQGAEIISHGRTGGFTFSIGTLRNQAHLAAVAIMQVLRRHQLVGPSQSDLVVDLHTPLGAEPEELVARLAERYHSEVGEPISGRLGSPDGRLRSVVDLLRDEDAADDDLLIAAITLCERAEWAAALAMSDISVLHPLLRDAT